MALKNGFFIDKLSLPNLSIEQLYIKWDEKISLDINNLTIKSSKTTSRVKKSDILNTLEYTVSALPYFKSIIINNLKADDIEANIRFCDTDNKLNIDSNLFNLKSKLSYNKEFIELDVDSLTSKIHDIEIKSKTIIDISHKFKIGTDATIRVGQSNFELTLLKEKTKLYYLVSADESIKNLKEIVSVFALDDDIKYWVDDAIGAKEIELYELRGEVDLKNPTDAYKNIIARASVLDATYTYDPKLDLVKSTQVDLLFKDGVLYIDPKKPFSYGFDLGSSHLNIDFNNLLLTLWLDFDGVLNSDILGILSHYGIDLPLKQLAGKTATKLTLKVDLDSLDTTADGVFIPKDSKIEYLGYVFDVDEAKVELKDTHIKTDKFLARYEENIRAYVTLDIDASKDSGRVDFDVQKLKLDELELKNLPQKAHYTISPHTHKLVVPPTLWSYKDEEILVDEVKDFTLDTKTYKAKIPQTFLRVKEYAAMSVGGEIDFESQVLNLDARLIRSEIENIKLPNTTQILHINYDKDVTISSKDGLLLDVFDKKTTIKNLDIKIDDGNLVQKNLKLNIQNMLSARVDMLGKNSSLTLDIKDLNLLDTFYKTDENLKAQIKKTDSRFNLNIPNLARGYIEDGELNLEVSSLADITKYSPKYKELQKGSLSLKTTNSKDGVAFFIKLQDTYPLLTEQNSLITNYDIKGIFAKDEIDLNINDKVNIAINSNVTIKANNAGLNILEFLDLLDRVSDESEKKDTIKVIANTTDCYAYISPDRFVISDSAKAVTKDNWLVIKLKHKDGEANLRLRDKKFSFYGDGFDDKFMSALFANSKFEGGNLKFSIDGLTDNFHGIILAENTILHEYKLLNNILAFVNTVPSLLTFSLPGYSTKGLNIETSYMEFDFTDETYNINNFYLKSKEIQMSGNGKASVLKNSVDMELSLKTDIGSSISKIPLVGYILMGNDTVSTTLKIEGKLDEPTIKTQVAKDIMVAPLNIIKRTLMLPFGGSDD